MSSRAPKTPRTAAQTLGGISATPSADEYTGFRPLLFRALASLARQGYIVSPDEGLELIHDFFLEAWPGLHQRYEPSISAFPTYVFGAFVRFARPRIVRTRKWHERFVAVDPAELDSFATTESRQYGEPEFDSVRRAMKCLSEDDREFLMRWLVNGSSDRRLASTLGLSRYKVRQRLVTALARLADMMGEQVGSSVSDWRVAKALWSEERSVADTAAMLGMTTSQVRLARQRVYDFLTNGLARGLSRSHTSEEECSVS